MKLNIRYGKYSCNRFRYDFGWSIQDGGPRTAVHGQNLDFSSEEPFIMVLKNVNHHIN